VIIVAAGIVGWSWWNYIHAPRFDSFLVKNKETIVLRGTISFSELEGGCFVFHTDDGKVFELYGEKAKNIKDSSTIDKKISIQGKVRKDIGSICMVGKDGFLEVVSYEFIDESGSLNELPWKTYQNQKYGFEFQYPGNTSVQDTAGSQNSGHLSYLGFYIGNSNVGVEISDKNEFLRENRFANELQELTLDFNLYQEDLNTARRNSGEELWGGPVYYSLLKRKVDGIPALDVRMASVGGNDRTIYLMQEEIVIGLYHNKPYFFLSNEEKARDTEYADFEKFLSTFRFISKQLQSCGPQPPVECGFDARLLCVNGKWDCIGVEEDSTR